MPEMPGVAKISKQPGCTPARARIGTPASTFAAMRLPYPVLKSARPLVSHSVVVFEARTYRMSVKPSSRRNSFARADGGSHGAGLTRRTVVVSGGGSVAPAGWTTGPCGPQAASRLPPASAAPVPSVRRSSSRLVTTARAFRTPASSHAFLAPYDPPNVADAHDDEEAEQEEEADRVD